VRDLVLGLAIASAVIAAVPIVVFPFRPRSALDPYRNRRARWVAYTGAGVALALFVILARRS
jgi:hypothetical protein